MAKISSKQRKFLKSKAHNLKPVVMIGNAGLTDNIHTEIEIALEYHELVKVKLTSNRDTRDEMVKTICLKASAIEVQVIGHVLVLFKKVREPKILLPKD